MLTCLFEWGLCVKKSLLVYFSGKNMSHIDLQKQCQSKREIMILVP